MLVRFCGSVVNAMVGIQNLGLITLTHANVVSAVDVSLFGSTEVQLVFSNNGETPTKESKRLFSVAFPFSGG